MIFWSSSESYYKVSKKLNKIREIVFNYANSSFYDYKFDKIDCEIRYVPIIMPHEMAFSYPERTRVLPKSHVIDLCPQLNYNLFLNGHMNESITDYTKKIAMIGNELEKFGANKDQIKDFKHIFLEGYKVLFI